MVGRVRCLFRPAAVAVHETLAPQETNISLPACDMGAVFGISAKDRAASRDLAP